MEIHTVQSDQPLFKSSNVKFAGLTLTGQYFYLKGDADTNGSVRFNTTSGQTRLEIRIADKWKGTTWP